MTENRFPLEWPATWPRTAADKRQADKFKVSFAVAREELLQELRALKTTDVVISANLPLRLDGLPLAKAPRPEDPGVAVYFTRRDQRLCVPCDSWMEVRGNLRAIGLAIQAIRGLERWGAGGMVTAAFSGFAALPAATEDPDAWWVVLDTWHNASRDEIEKAYRNQAKYFHPDVGGTSAEFRRLQKAYEEAIVARG